MDGKDAPFSNREIREMVQDTNNAIGRVEAQTIKTNGRVTALERWMYIAIGAIAVISSIGVPQFLNLLQANNELDDKISQSIEDALQDYDITYVPN